METQELVLDNMVSVNMNVKKTGIKKNVRLGMKTKSMALTGYFIAEKVVKV